MNNLWLIGVPFETWYKMHQEASWGCELGEVLIGHVCCYRTIQPNYLTPNFSRNQILVFLMGYNLVSWKIRG